MKKIYFIISFCSLLAGCSKQATVGIARNPVISFTAPSMTWQAANYFFSAPAQVVAYPADTTQKGRLYSRFTLQANGTNDKGQNLQLILMFDVVDATQLIGTYRTRYTTSRGLAQAQIFNLSGNNLASYMLRAGDTTAVFNIQRQSQQELLIAGSFQMRLYNTRDTSQVINITKGTFTDINY